MLPSISRLFISPSNRTGRMNPENCGSLKALGDSGSDLDPSLLEVRSANISGVAL